MEIGIIGSGVMGSGIAQAFAMCAEHRVTLCDISVELAEKGRQRIISDMEASVTRGKMDKASAELAASKITAGINKDVKDCDLIVEAALENMEIKKKLFSELSEICKADAIFATNTSSLSVTELSAKLDRPVIGMHFFNPAPRMKLVEVIAGLSTPPELVEKVKQIAADMGKVPVVVKDSAGFVVNRILIPMINEAVGVLAEGVASAEDIDTSMKLGANLPMGPLALGDLIGLDVCLAIMEVLHAESGDQKYRPHPLLRNMVRGGMLGKKTKQGFYNY